MKLSELLARIIGNIGRIFLFLYLWNHTGAPWTVYFTTIGLCFLGGGLVVLCAKALGGE